MKTQEIPPIIRGFYKVFDKLCYRHDYTTVFDDFMTLTVCCYAWKTEEELYFETIRKYDKVELDLFPKLIGEWLMIHSSYQHDNRNDWFDTLGTFYEILKSEYKAKALGQFFTPKCICDMIAQMNYAPSEEVQKINDPSCGSGRMLLAYNTYKPGHDLYYAADLDNMCVKMTCLNMMIHGMKGQVWHMNSLSLEYFGGWEINAMIDKEGLPSIIRLNERPAITESIPKPVIVEQKQFELNF